MPQSNAPSIGANLSRSRFPALLAAGALGQYFLSQSNSPWTLGPGLFFYALAFWLLSNDNKLNPQAPLNPPLDNLSPKSEFLLFILIFLLALFFRLYHLDSMPAGMHTDQGLMGEYGLWVLKGWRPFLDILPGPRIVPAISWQDGIASSGLPIFPFIGFSSPCPWRLFPSSTGLSGNGRDPGPHSSPSR